MIYGLRLQGKRIPFFDIVQVALILNQANFIENIPRLISYAPSSK